MFNQDYLVKVFSEIDLTSRKYLQIEESIFSRAVVGDMVKMLLPSISNTIIKSLPKNIQLCKHGMPCRKKAKVFKKLPAKLLRSEIQKIR